MHDTHATHIELNLAKKLSLAALNAPANKMTHGVGFISSCSGSTRAPPLRSGSNMMSAPANPRVRPEHEDTTSQSPRDHDLTWMNLVRDRERSRF
jgi:hypothetical protein